MRRPAAALLLLLAACGSDGEPTGKDAPNQADRSGFVERAVAAGLRFRSRLLPEEQGANFKINFYDHGSGVAVGDIDGDGDEDLYFVNQLGANALYRNNGDATFQDVTATSGPVALADRICVSAAFNDIDNDGDQDLFVTSTRGGNTLFRNDGAGHFTDVTKAAGVEEVAHTQGATFFDADRDGDLDLLVCNTAAWTSSTFHPGHRYYMGGSDLADVIRSPPEFNTFYRNRGDGTFEKATAESGLRGTGWGGDTAVFDYDEDGDPDLFLCNMFGSSLLYENDGTGKFRDVTVPALGTTPWGSVGTKAFDYDGDGRLDLFVVDMHSDMWVPFDYDLDTVDPRKKFPSCFGPMKGRPGAGDAEEALFLEQTRTRPAFVFYGNALYRNLGKGRFKEVSDRAGVETFWPWGIALGDFDNNGFLDAYLPSGMGYPWGFWRNPLLMNNGDGTFTEASARFGVDPPPGGTKLGRVRDRDAVKSSRSGAVADLDADGRVDIVVNNFNDRPYLYLNRWPRGDYIAFKLVGTKSNRDAVGAVLRLHAGSRVLVRQVHAAGGYLAQSSKTVHFGLEGAGRVDRVEITWPSGRRQVVDRPALNRRHVVKEPAQ